MRIYAVTPIHVSEPELARRQARYDSLCPPGLQVRLHDIGSDAPMALDTVHDVRASEALVTETLLRVPDGFDAVMPDCVLDPGVTTLCAELAVPVFGLLRITVGWSVCTGRKSAAVARNKAIADEIQARVSAYGWASELTGVEVLELGVDAIDDPRAWVDALSSARERFRDTGAATLVNGCSAVELPAGLDDPALRVVDPTAMALRLVAAGEAA